MQNHYDTLGMDREAPFDAARLTTAYRQAVMRYHPDRNLGLPPAEMAELTGRFRAATEAFDVLSDERLRVAYDRELSWWDDLLSSFQSTVRSSLSNSYAAHHDNPLLNLQAQLASRGHEHAIAAARLEEQARLCSSLLGRVRPVNPEAPDNPFEESLRELAAGLQAAAAAAQAEQEKLRWQISTVSAFVWLGAPRYGRLVPLPSKALGGTL